MRTRQELDYINSFVNAHVDEKMYGSISYRFEFIAKAVKFQTFDLEDDG